MQPASMAPAMAESLRAQLLAAHHRSHSFAGIVGDYMAALGRTRELQVRCSQLDKEAGELRALNEELLRAAEGSASAQELKEALAEGARVREQLTEAYKARAEALESQAEARSQLEVVRDLNSQQYTEIKALQADVARLRGEVERLTGARDLISAELAAAKVQASRAEHLEEENADLACRILEMKERQAEWLNEMNHTREQTLEDARRQAKDIVATAMAQARAQLPRAAAGGASAAALGASLRTIDLGSAAAGGPAPLPSTALRTVAGVHAGGCFGLAFARNGAFMASCGADRVVRLWDTSRCAETGALRGAHEGLNAVAVTCDSRLVLGAENQNAVRLWDVRSGRLVNVALTGHSGKVVGVDASPCDPGAAVTCSADRTIKLWKLERGISQKTLLVPSGCNCVALTLDGVLIVSGHMDGSLRLWDVRSERQAHEVAGLHSQGQGGITSVAVGLGGDTLLTCGRDNLLRCLDLRTFQVRSTLSAPTFIVGGTWTKACLSPSSTHAAAGSKYGEVFVWDLATGHVATRLTPTQRGRAGAGAAVREAVACAWSPLGSPLVSCDKAGGVTFWGEDGAGLVDG